MKKIFFLFAFALMSMVAVDAQELKYPDLDKSPMDAAHYPRTSAYNNYMPDDQKQPTQIKVLYCRPKKKDRVIFGELVPFGKEWRLGANEATEVTFRNAVEIGGVFVNRGTYTMFADVYPNQWILKISSQRFIAGTKDRDKSKDVVTVAIPTEGVPNSRESFTIGFQEVDDNHVNMVFEWDMTRATLPINLNPAYLSGDDKSPMDLVAYPNDSRFHNFLKEEELDAAAPKIRVTYSRPQKNDREIFGKLIKYGENWRIGANETTEVTFFDGATINGKKLRAGKYGMFAKVNEGEWEIVFHTNLPSWGVANHDEESNVATIKVPVQNIEKAVEALTILFDKKSDTEVHMIIAWDKTQVAVPVMLD